MHIIQKLRFEQFSCSIRNHLSDQMEYFLLHYDDVQIAFTSLIPSHSIASKETRTLACLKKLAWWNFVSIYAYNYVIISLNDAIYSCPDKLNNGWYERMTGVTFRHLFVKTFHSSHSREQILIKKSHVNIFSRVRKQCLQRMWLIQ